MVVVLPAVQLVVDGQAMSAGVCVQLVVVAQQVIGDDNGRGTVGDDGHKNAPQCWLKLH